MVSAPTIQQIRARVAQIDVELAQIRADATVALGGLNDRVTELLKAARITKQVQALDARRAEIIDDANARAAALHEERQAYLAASPPPGANDRVVDLRRPAPETSPD